MVTGPKGYTKHFDPLFPYPIEPEISTPEKSAFVLNVFGDISNAHCCARSDNHKMEFSKFEIRVLFKHYWKQDYNAAAVAPRMCEMEGGVVSEGVAQ